MKNQPRCRLQAKDLRIRLACASLWADAETRRAQ